jgi:SAM-dependent methyltransferase
MSFKQYLGRSMAATGVALVLVVGASQAQQPAKDFEPQVGQAGKDVIWVPTQLAMVNRMLDTAKLTKDDYVIDLGSGDGRTVITAAKRGATALGIEYNPDMVELSKRNAVKEGVTDKATFMKADIFESDFSKATVITMFLLSDINLRLRPKILDMKAGTRIVSNTFDMGDWEADEKFEVKEGCSSYCRGFHWVVPAKVDGSWKSSVGQIAFKQNYQMLTGTVTNGNVVAPITGKLSGDKITFTAGGVQYTGTVNGGKIEGMSKSGSSETKWDATKG